MSQKYLNSSHDDLESTRKKYKPNNVKILFISQSPPDKNSFFYRTNSRLFDFTLQSFENMFGSNCGVGYEFLEFFQEHECYQEDLVSESTNGMAFIQKHNKRQDSINSLFHKIEKLESLEAIITVHSGIKRQVIQAIAQSLIPAQFHFHSSITKDKKPNIKVNETRIPCYFLYFPALGFQSRFVKELGIILGDLKKRNILHNQKEWKNVS